MQPGQPPPSLGRPPMRAPGSFSPLPGVSNSSVESGRKPSAPKRPPPLQINSSGSDESLEAPSLHLTKSRQRPDSPGTPVFFNQFSTANSNLSSSNLDHNFFRPAGSSRLGVAAGPSSPSLHGHSRKHSATQGLFDSTLPSTNMSNLSHHSTNATAGSIAAAAAAAAAAASNSSLSASQIAAQAAVMSHQNGSHARQRSQTVPFPGESADGIRRGSGHKAPMSPPMLSFTEASAPRDSALASAGGQAHDRAPHAHFSAATAAANVVFPRSGPNSPREKSTSPQPQPFPPIPSLPASIPAEKVKAEKKHKLFSRPGKGSSSKTESKEKHVQSPGKIGTALSALQRGNFSTTSLVDQPAPSLYSLNNSSSATIRPTETLFEERVKEKEKKHHFLSRQKQKLKDEYHLPLSSAASNSKPTDPNAPSSLYNFNLPPSPGPGSSFAKAKKDKKTAEKAENRIDNESTFNLVGDWNGAGSLPPLSQQASVFDAPDSGKFLAQHNLSSEDAWPYLKAKLLVVFEGEDLRLPVEDFNRVVQTHIQWCIHKRAPGRMLDDLRDLLATGFSVLDRTLRLTPEDRFIPTLVELWLFTFTSILPYMQSVFLPLELEMSGCGVLMTPDQARDFWGNVSAPNRAATTAAPASNLPDVRRLVLTAYRDMVVLPRYEMLKTIFSRLSLEFLPSSFGHAALASPSLLEHTLSHSPSESQSSVARPGTAMSLDPLVGSYNSSSTTLLGDGSERGRSRAVSNVSFGSHGSDGLVGGGGGGGGSVRPHTPSSNVPVLATVREQNVEDSKQVTDMVGRMLQCMSVLSGIGGAGDADDEGSKKIEELCKMLKLNWLGRGRTGRNRRGIVGGRVRRDDAREEVRVA